MKTVRQQSRGVLAHEHVTSSLQNAVPIFKELNPDNPPSVPASANGNATTSVRTDEQLIAAYQAGDRNSFTELVTRYERELFHFLVRFLSDKAAAEDVFQETFLQIHQSAHDFD